MKAVNAIHYCYEIFSLTFSLHVKAPLARTMLSVFLNINGIPITVSIVNLDFLELTANEKEIKPAVRSNYLISPVVITSSTLTERAE